MPPTWARPGGGGGGDTRGGGDGPVGGALAGGRPVAHPGALTPRPPAAAVQRDGAGGESLGRPRVPATLFADCTRAAAAAAAAAWVPRRNRTAAAAATAAVAGVGVAAAAGGGVTHAPGGAAGAVTPAAHACVGRRPAVAPRQRRPPRLRQ